MGQYYLAYVKAEGNEDGQYVEKVFSPFESLFCTKNGFADDRSHPDSFNMDADMHKDFYDLSCGYKLMEHSWALNPYIEGVMSVLVNGPARVAWVGDYADPDEDPCAKESPELADVYRKCWCEPDEEKGESWDDGVWKLPESAFDEMPDMTGESTTHAQYGFLVNHDKKEYIDLKEYCKRSTKEGWCAHPLPLLTVWGNGRGGGDYWGSDKELCGHWLYDTLSWEANMPSGMKEIKPTFVE